MNGTAADDNTQSALPRSLLLSVLVVGLSAHLWYFASSRVVVLPDSNEFASLGVGLAERLDWGAELFQFRPPVYPGLLAIVFRVFGADSGVVLVAIQHLLIVATACVAAGIAWTLRPSRLMAGVAGIATATSVHLAAYANIVLTEAIYTLLIVASLYCLLRHYRTGGWRVLAWGSLWAGLAGLTKPLGSPMVVLCVAFAVVLAYARVGAGGLCWRRRVRGMVRACVVAAVPAAAVTLPVMVLSYCNWGQFRTDSLGMAYFYPRTRWVERLDSDTSAAVAKMDEAFRIARARGALDESVTPFSTWSYWEACRVAYGWEVSQTAELMADVSRDLIREHFWLLVARTPGHMYRMMAIPDDNFRIVPGGAVRGNASLPSSTGLVAVDRYAEMVRRNAMPERIDRYLSLSNDPTATSGLWNRVLHWYDRRIGHGAPLVGILDTPYEELMLLVYLGGAIAMLCRPRAAWLLVMAVVGYHIGVSATLQGGVSRYAIPVFPLFNVLAGLTLLCGLRVVRRVADSMVRIRVSMRSGQGIRPGSSPASATN